MISLACKTSWIIKVLVDWLPIRRQHQRQEQIRSLESSPGIRWCVAAVASQRTIARTRKVQLEARMRMIRPEKASRTQTPRTYLRAQMNSPTQIFPTFSDTWWRSCMPTANRWFKCVSRCSSTRLSCQDMLRRKDNSLITTINKWLITCVISTQGIKSIVRYRAHHHRHGHQRYSI